MTQQEIEAELDRQLGIEKVLWLPRVSTFLCHPLPILSTCIRHALCNPSKHTTVITLAGGVGTKLRHCSESSRWNATDLLRALVLK